MSPEPLVVCRGLTKVYVTPTGSLEALHDVDAEFEAGQVTAVVGASGSGKSTLLRAIAGLDRPSRGELRVAGQELDGAPGSALRENRRDVVTYVAQRAAANFVPHLTLAEQSENSHDESLELFRAFGIEHRLHSHPAELSGGEQARAAFALALARNTPIVVSDEPTAELDHDSAHRLLDAIRTHAAAGTAFILATHDPEVVEAADRVLRLERGRVITGEPPAVKPLRTRRTVETRAGHLRPRRGQDLPGRRRDDPGASLGEHRARARRGRRRARPLGLREVDAADAARRLAASRQRRDPVRAQLARTRATCSGTSWRSCRSASACFPS